jgi:hypothetical protein
MRPFDIDLRGFTTILAETQSAGARALDAAVIRGSPVETVLPAHCGATFGTVTLRVRYGSEPWQVLIDATISKLDDGLERGLQPGL